MNRPTLSASVVLACVVACGTASPPPPAPGPLPVEGDAHDAAWVTRRCTEEYAQIEANWATYAPKETATSDFRHCPRWRMAAAGACGAPVQPSFMAPCHCMCDLCDHDADCTQGSGGLCVEMSSVLGGGYPERVCVYATDACHPAGAQKCATRCVTLFGHTQCAPKDGR